MNRAGVLLDRDGTLIHDVGYLSLPQQVRFCPGAVEAVRMLNLLGVTVAIVTNQSGVARGYFDEAAVHAVHAAIQDRLRMAGAHIDRFYHCPHHPGAVVPEYRVQCRCRKPAPGMVEAALRDLGLCSRRTWVIGDMLRDAEAGLAAGCNAILLSHHVTNPALPNTAGSLWEAVSRICRCLERSTSDQC